MTPLSATPRPPAPEPREPGTRRVDPEGLPISLPSDAFAGSECITKAEWERRHAGTYPDRKSEAPSTAMPGASTPTQTNPARR